jgi:hypothetical protein
MKIKRRARMGVRAKTVISMTDILRGMEEMRTTGTIAMITKLKAMGEIEIERGNYM